MLTLTISCNEEASIQSSKDQYTSAENPHAKYIYTKKAEAGIANRTTYYTIANALTYANDGMNFLYCRPDDYFEQTIIHKDTFLVAVNGSGEIEEADLIDLMDNIAEFAGGNYYAEQRSDKEPLMFHMRQVFGGGSGFIPIEAAFAMVAGLPTSAQDEYPYEDSWIYGQWGQNVSEQCSEEEANVDAADLFRRDLRANLAYRNKNEAYYFINPYVGCYSGLSDDCASVEIAYNYFPPDIIFDGVDLINQNDVTPNDNLNDYLVFRNQTGFSNFHDCVSTNEMNFHFESMTDLVEDQLPNPLGNSKIAQIEVGYNLLTSSSTTIFHSMLVVVAIKVAVIEEEDKEALPLPCC